MSTISASEKALTKSQHSFFLWALQRLVGPLQPARMVGGQVWEQTYTMAGTQVALSDTERNTRTDKKGQRHSYGTLTVEFIATEPGQQRQGAATHQLKALGKLADRWNIRLRLRPMAHESSPMNDAQLSAWYQGLGYTEADGLYLTRLPAEQRRKADKQATQAEVVA